MTLRFIAIGLDHPHIYCMTENLLALEAQCLGYWTIDTPKTLEGYQKQFPDIPRFDTLERALGSAADFALISAIPPDRAELAIRAMRQGMDVMTGKPGCTTLDQLDQIKDCVAKTGRIWSIKISDRFEGPAVTRTSAFIEADSIGKVVQTVGLGPRRLNPAARPDWFLQRARYGGILTYISSHQIDQFLHFTASDTAQVTHAFVANYANSSTPEMQDFGGAEGTDHIVLVNGEICKKNVGARCRTPLF